MKRTVSILLAAVLLLSCVGFLAPRVSASEYTTSEKCINMLKEMEGMSKYPYWDYLQWTVGYGTKFQTLFLILQTAAAQIHQRLRKERQQL